MIGMKATPPILAKHRSHTSFNGNAINRGKPYLL